MNAEEVLDELDRITKETCKAKKLIAVAVSEAFALGLKCGVETCDMSREELDQLRADLAKFG